MVAFTVHNISSPDLYFNGLVQERCNSSVLAMELRLSYTKPSILFCDWPYNGTEPHCLRLGYMKFYVNCVTLNVVPYSNKRMTECYHILWTMSF